MKFHRIRLTHGSKGRMLVHRDRENPAFVFVHAPSTCLRMTENEVIAFTNALVDTLEDPDPTDRN